MGPNFVYRCIANTQDADQTANDAAFHWIEANSRQGWEFVQILDLDGEKNRQLLFRKPV
jgi:hypothetical protein